MDAPSKWPTKARHVQRWYLSLASALERMHGASFRHKDIKPANVLIKGDSVVLADFGTSLEFAPDSSNSTGHALMTPKYCAPEVARHQTRGRSSDIFSLGCVFLELITVEIQSTLDNLNNCLRDQDRNNSRAKAYHQRLDLVQTWIQVLNAASRDNYQRTVLSLCSAMLAGKPDLRPTAASIVVDLCKARKVFPGPVDKRCPCCCYGPFPTNIKDVSSNFGMSSKQSEESVGLRSITLPKSMNGVKLLIPSGNSYSVTPWDSGLLDLRSMEEFEWLWSSALATSGTIASADSLAIHKFLQHVLRSSYQALITSYSALEPRNDATIYHCLEQDHSHLHRKEERKPGHSQRHALSIQTQPAHKSHQDMFFAFVREFSLKSSHRRAAKSKEKHSKATMTSADILTILRSSTTAPVTAGLQRQGKSLHYPLPSPTPTSLSPHQVQSCSTLLQRFAKNLRRKR